MSKTALWAQMCRLTPRCSLTVTPPSAQVVGTSRMAGRDCGGEALALHSGGSDGGKNHTFLVHARTRRRLLVFFSVFCEDSSNIDLEIQEI